ncbi:DNA-formamidopyrimidine glycosylase [Holzapfeliella sp. He02]|uniref:Formamidopyrimidine-DNA glycosylase n=1 Tax=Holzapfeliella saturejae TaxID=3082953 RepID=A0ABU8SGY2_9LACO
MPELPEVETVRKTLTAQVQGKKIESVDVIYPNIVSGDVDQFKAQLQGQTIEKIDRIGKYLLLRLSHQLTIVSHLRMEGKYRLVSSQTPIQKHEHLSILFTDGTQLRYDDVRKFGRLQLVETGRERVETGIRYLGYEPNQAEFTSAYFYQALQKKKKNIKNTLLDQSIVSGLGNIYVDEVLWLSHIHPLTKAQDLTKAQVLSLHQAINEEIKLAIELNGTTIRSYHDSNGNEGQFQNFLHVYGKQGKPCERCQTTIEKIKVNGRGTSFCPNCQVVKNDG